MPLSDTHSPSPLELLLQDPAPLIDTPASRTAFSLALMSSDLFVPVEQSEDEQARAGGVSLQAIDIDAQPHVLLFTSREKLADFTAVNTRFARASGADIFPNLRGAYAVLNPGALGRQFTPQDIAALLGDEAVGCGAPGHVHTDKCSH